MLRKMANKSLKSISVCYIVPLQHCVNLTQQQQHLNYDDDDDDDGIATV